MNKKYEGKGFANIILTWLTPDIQAFDNLKTIVAECTLVNDIIKSSACSTVPSINLPQRCIIFHFLDRKADYPWQPCITKKMLAEINKEHRSTLFPFENLENMITKNS